VVFGVDALGAWLVEQLADASRKRLTELVLGSDQERALRQAAVAAVQDTADEMAPSGEQAGQMAMIIREVFSERLPDRPHEGPVTLLEELQAGIARQLSVLDDADLTGTGQSSAQVLGVPGTALAERLTSHLVREIMLRGSRGGPLASLADQLNHDLTHLQGQRIEGILVRLASELRSVPLHTGGGAAAGRPLGDVNDPFVLEVHRPVQVEELQPGLPVLPTYVLREHDVELRRLVRAAAGGNSGIAVLVGGSSTGKTRACWEALQLLRDRPDQWRLWHPIDPSRPEAALHELSAIGPRTVVWLNEAQFYLDVTEGALGERVAAGLRELLRDRARAPVLVLATLWPEFWDSLTALPARPASDPDPHAQARELLTGHDIAVPASFTARQVQGLRNAGDPRVAKAAAVAQDGQVIQFLAGAPELLVRYRHATPAAAALIRAAMDARRLGMGIGLPKAFLAAAAPGYLTDTEWDSLGEDWLEQGLTYTAVSCKGARGPLTRIRPRPVRSRTRRSGSRESNGTKADGNGRSSRDPLYQLADYLDQHGRHHRKGHVPPEGFWVAAEDHVSLGDQAALGGAAHARGLYRHAAQLFKNAAACGNVRAACYLSGRPGCLSLDVRPALWAAAHMSLEDPSGVAAVLRALVRSGAEEPVMALLDRDPAARVSLVNPGEVIWLLDALQDAGARQQFTALAGRAAAQIPLDEPYYIATLFEALHRAGAQEPVAALLHRDPAAHVSLDDPGGVAALLGALWEAGAQQQFTVLAERAAVHVPLGGPGSVYWILRFLRQAGARQQVTTLLHRNPAAHVSLDDPSSVAQLLAALEEAGAQDQVTALAERASNLPLGKVPTVVLLDLLRQAGAQEQATALAERAAAHTPLDDPQDVTWLLFRLRQAGAQEQATALAERAAAHTPLDDPDGLAWLLDGLRETGAQRQLATLLRRNPAAHVSLDKPGGVGRLLDHLRVAGAQQQVTTLLRRNPAAHVSVDDPGDVARLLWSLSAAGAQKQATALAERAAAHVPLDDPDGVAQLLDGLRETGAQRQVATLLRRNPAAHISLNKPYALAQLLGGLQRLGADQQVTALAERAVHIPLADQNAVTRLLDRLRAAGAEDQATALERRLPGEGMFELFLKQQSRQDPFRFGRQADGSPAEPWGWEDLE
jgi:uncharacterized protein YidB (DUF937 family)